MTKKEYTALKKRRNVIQMTFMKLINLPSLAKLWMNATEILSIINDLYPSDFETVKHIINSLKPIIESFFISYKVLYNEEDLIYDEET